MSEFETTPETAEELWMAMTPCVELGDSPGKLTIGQIGRCSYEWDQPDEYGEATEYVDVYEYVIGVSCDKCSGSGRIIPYPESQDTDMVIPPYHPPNDRCDLCDGSGIIHRRSNRLNEIRLTKQQKVLRRRCESYYSDLESKVRWVPWDCVTPEEQSTEYLERTCSEDWGIDAEGRFPIDPDDEEDYLDIKRTD
ncbi:Chaperone protein DnaJ [Olavius algarvensis associated proteobacterium Delta 3]|nr:Chaperone protein DnaJ [Olavius algarvensis associated proteobacterium Delta 3]CAB5152451.1 Chaperone protein DnaJ [Olavius algarvensis associated proteobacterium Delta 3]